MVQYIGKGFIRYVLKTKTIKIVIISLIFFVGIGFLLQQNGILFGQLIFPYLTQTNIESTALPIPFIASVDTMKYSRDAETYPLTQTQINDIVHASASLGNNYVTVDTHWDYPDYMAEWISSIRQTGKHVWFRIQPNQWENNNHVTGIMSPEAYTQAVSTFITSHRSFFQPEDIFDPCPEPEQGHYWAYTYGSSWSHHAPNSATRAYNAFLRDTTTAAQEAFKQMDIHGVITNVRSINSFFATHPDVLEKKTVDTFSLITFDSYPDEKTTNAFTATQLRVQEIEQIEHIWHVPIILGELGFDNTKQTTDIQQQHVLASELQGVSKLSYIRGVNYWVGAGQDVPGQYTHIITWDGTTSTFRPAAQTLKDFFTQKTIRGV